MNHAYHGYFWGMHWIWWILFLIIIVLIVSPNRITGSRKKEETPMDILKKRLAKGEIDKEEYEEKKRILEQN